MAEPKMERALRGAEHAFERTCGAASFDDQLEGIVEALNWLYILHERVDAGRRSELYERQPALAGLRWIRARVVHDEYDPLRLVATSDACCERYTNLYGAFVWNRDLPEQAGGGHGRDAYERHVSERCAVDTLGDAIDGYRTWFATA